MDEILKYRRKAFLSSQKSQALFESLSLAQFAFPTSFFAFSPFQLSSIKSFSLKCKLKSLKTKSLACSHPQSGKQAREELAWLLATTATTRATRADRMPFASWERLYTSVSWTDRLMAGAGNVPICLPHGVPGTPLASIPPAAAAHSTLHVPKLPLIGIWVGNS